MVGDIVNIGFALPAQKLGIEIYTDKPARKMI